mmetsp:Transcript_54315/g.174146  ORF Transcript_54315/g.174146 Transcript_54315/m.174146 type:complete len:298 (+) Transcript_54315:822-1715(+)
MTSATEAPSVMSFTERYRCLRERDPPSAARPSRKARSPSSQSPVLNRSSSSRPSCEPASSPKCLAPVFTGFILSQSAFACEACRNATAIGADSSASIALPARYHVWICGSDLRSCSSAERREAISWPVPSLKTTLLPRRKWRTASDRCTERQSSSKQGCITCLQRSMRPSGNSVPLSRRRGKPFSSGAGARWSSCRNASKHSGPGMSTGSASGRATASRGSAHVFGAARRLASRASCWRASTALRILCSSPSNFWCAAQPVSAGKKRCDRRFASSPQVPRCVFGTRTQRSEKGLPAP